MRTFSRLTSLFVLASILLSSCSLPLFRDGKLSIFPNKPDPTQQTPAATVSANPNFVLPASDEGRCVIGSWKVEDITGFQTLLHAAWLNLPDAWKDRQQITVTRSSGEMILTFDDRGVVTGAGRDYQVDADVLLAGIKLKLGLAVNGSGHAYYQVDETTRTVSFMSPAGDGMTVTVKLNKQTMLKDVNANDMGIIKKLQRGIGLRFACSGDSMRIDVEASDGEAIPQAVMLTRVK